jgi:peptide deformylase
MFDSCKNSDDSKLFKNLYGKTSSSPFYLLLFENTPKVMHEGMHVEEAKKWAEENGNGLVTDVVELLSNLNNVAGIASNQLVIRATGKRVTDRFFVTKNAEPSGAVSYSFYLNPQIKAIGDDERECVEGCLTWPNKVILANRSKTITISFFDIHGLYKEQTFTGFPAQVVQHEMDHLYGVPEKVVDKDYRTIKSDKVGRNDPCVCGSGKKYKKCCGR